MDLQGSLLDTNLRIYPSSNLLDYFKSIPINDDVPLNIVKFLKGKDFEPKQKTHKDTKEVPLYLDSKDIENLNKIRATIKVEENETENIEHDENVTKNEDKINEELKNDSKKIYNEDFNDLSQVFKQEGNEKQTKEDCNEKTKNDSEEKEIKLHLETADVDWLYAYLNKLRSKGDKKVPYLYKLLEGAQIEIPENEVIKRNPVLEARCVKLRAQQEAREYRKMTKTVDNVRMRFPEDSISYQLKQVNRQLIAIGQFIISIFAGFLFGFKGIEWMIGYLDFGFRLLMGVMCALIIALAEIYFLAKKLNEELNIPETVQLGGPPKFADSQLNPPKVNKAIEKDHQD